MVRVNVDNENVNHNLRTFIVTLSTYENCYVLMKCYVEFVACVVQQ